MFEMMEAFFKLINKDFNDLMTGILFTSFFLVVGIDFSWGLSYLIIIPLAVMIIFPLGSIFRKSILCILALVNGK
jgi:hypothetical protein